MMAKTNLTEQSYFQNTTTFAKIFGQSSPPQSLFPTHVMGDTCTLAWLMKHKHVKSLSAPGTIEGSSQCTVLQLTHVSTLDYLEPDLTKHHLSAIVLLGSKAQGFGYESVLFDIPRNAIVPSGQIMYMSILSPTAATSLKKSK